jgi:hypothetical protein
VCNAVGEHVWECEDELEGTVGEPPLAPCGPQRWGDAGASDEDLVYAARVGILDVAAPGGVGWYIFESEGKFLSAVACGCELLGFDLERLDTLDQVGEWGGDDLGEGMWLCL